MTNLKYGATVIIEHGDLANLLTEALCDRPPFRGLRVTFISQQAGQFKITLWPIAKPVAAKVPEAKK